jgi:hypothetical protein
MKKRCSSKTAGPGCRGKKLPHCFEMNGLGCAPGAGSAMLARAIAHLGGAVQAHLVVICTLLWAGLLPA